MACTNCYVVFLLLGFGLATAVNVRAPLVQNQGWWKNTAFYQIYPRSFKDSNGDGIGDLNGITSKLEHFKDIGVGAIWLSPIYPSPMVDFGYDISDFVGISEEYGNMIDFETLTKTAKGLGLKVILDLVPNHVSDQHDWFKKSIDYANNPDYKDYFIWKDSSNATFPTQVPPNNWISVFGKSAWTYNDVRKQWYFHQFHEKQPDLNYNNPKVRNEMKKVIQFWLEKGVDGFRVDAVPHLFEVENLWNEPLSNNPDATGPDDYTYLDHPYTKDQPETYQLVKSWRNILDDWAIINGGDERIMMTEAYTSLEKTVEYYDYGSHIPFNFKFITDVNVNSTASEFKVLIDSWMTEANKRNGVSNWVMGNHDRSRTETRYPDRGDQMTMLAMVLPGVSVTYYGEEIGMVDKDDISYADTQDPQGCIAGPEKFKEKSRDPCRTPFQWDDTANAGFSTNKTNTWLPVNVNFKTLNLAAQQKANVSHYKLYKSLTKLKAESPALQSGSLGTVVKNGDKALAILRTHMDANETVILVINFSDVETLVVDLSGDIPSNFTAKGIVQVATLNSRLQSGASVDLTKISLDPKSSLVILADELRNTSKEPDDNSVPDGGSSISFTKVTTTLLVVLLITLS